MPITFKNAWQTLGEEWFCAGEVMPDHEGKVFICPSCYEPAVAVLVYRGGKANQACTSCTENHVIPFSKPRYAYHMIDMFIERTSKDEWDNPVYVDANHWLEESGENLILYKKGSNGMVVGKITKSIEFCPEKNIDDFMAA